MKSFDKYKTRAGANAGQKLQLKDAAGKETGDWLIVHGVDSDAFRNANNRMRREILDYLEANGGPDQCLKTDAYAEFTEQAKARVQAALIHSWSFPEPCTPEAKLELLIEAPDVANQVDAFSGKRERFVAIAPVASEPSPSTRPGSRSQQQATHAPR